MSTKSVFIAGGAGFIGRWLVARCLEEGFRVAVYDNLCAGRLENLTPFLGQIEFFEADILDEGKLQAALKKTSACTLIHLAAHHYIPFCNAHPLETLKVNAVGTYSVLNAALTCGTRTVVIASSGAIYRSTESPLAEDCEAPAPTDVYGLSKVQCERIAKFFADNTHLSCVVARLFNTYGPYETNPHLIPHIVQSLRLGPRVELGNTHTYRDYVYVEDVAKALLRCSGAIDQHFTVVNVGFGIEYCAVDIINQIAAIMGKEIEVVTKPERMRAVDKEHQIADTKKLWELTGLRAEHTLQDGLRKLLKHEGLI